jgi:phosphodiesterase/alkaline phosphatase D-like protein
MKRSVKIFVAGLAAAVVTVGAAVAASTPAVVTQAATNATNTTVKLHGTVNPEGSSSNYAFQWGLTNAYGFFSPAHSAGSGTKAVSVATTPTGLIPGTTYHYRVIAGNRFGNSQGLDHKFKTTGHPPAITVTGPTFGRPSQSGAVVTGNINPNGQNTTWQFEYGMTTAYGVLTAPQVLPASHALSSVHAVITGLQPGVTFHYQLISVHNGGAQVFGGDQTFTTIPNPRPVPGLDAKTTPSRASHRPYLFTTSGRIRPSSSLPASVSCNGTVAVRFFLGRDTRALRTAQVKPDCTYFSQVLFHKLIGRGSTRLRVEVRFHGNAYIGSSHTHVQRVHLG